MSYAPVGLEDTWEAARAGRVGKAVITRLFKPKGTRCRKCDHLDLEEKSACGSCGSDSIYGGGVVNELVKALTQTGSSVEFVDPIPSLTDSGEVAALLRY